VLYDDGRIGDQGPEVVGPNTRVALEVFEKGSLVGVVIGVCLNYHHDCMSVASSLGGDQGGAYTTASPRAASGSACASCSDSERCPCA
jgi:hypothetical protein